MKISTTFDVARPREEIWRMFQDVPRVALCIPGTRVTETLDEGTFKGHVEVKLGPVNVAFAGEATHQADATAWSGTIAGNGRDRATGSRARFTTHYQLNRAGGGTRVTVESDIVLAGAVAQFGRTGLVEEITTRMLDQFARNLETELAGDAVAASEHPHAGADLGSLLASAVRAWCRSLWRKLCGRRQAGNR